MIAWTDGHELEVGKFSDHFGHTGYLCSVCKDDMRKILISCSQQLDETILWTHLKTSHNWGHSFNLSGSHHFTFRIRLKQ